jgi:hypothetical protein
MSQKPTFVFLPQPNMPYGTCPNCGKTNIVLYKCTKCGTVQCSWGKCKSSSCHVCSALKKPID